MPARERSSPSSCVDAACDAVQARRSASMPRWKPRSAKSRRSHGRSKRGSNGAPRRPAQRVAADQERADNTARSLSKILQAVQPGEVSDATPLPSPRKFMNGTAAAGAKRRDHNNRNRRPRGRIEGIWRSAELAWHIIVRHRLYRGGTGIHRRHLHPLYRVAVPGRHRLSDIAGHHGGDAWPLHCSAGDDFSKDIGAAVDGLRCCATFIRRRGACFKSLSRV